MTSITIPSKLDDRLGQDALGHAVRLYVKQFEGWVGDDTKGLFFFPEYTDHGPKHISSVLAAAEALIREESWPLLTTEDAAVLVLATLLHDSAMHLTADGLLDLLNPERAAKRPLIGLLDSKTWPALFDDFFAEARRWDQRKLYRILGDQNKPAEEEEDLVDTIRHPSELTNPEKWTTRYRKFLGEFVRRHHARLAHEIVHEGVPGNTPGILKPPNDLGWVADLAGLVARSHNMSLRGTFDYLVKKYWGRTTCHGSHPVFLMVLLRIADYLEIRADRVNPTLLEIQRLRSPLSQEEQDSHADVEEVRPHEQDEEAIFILARPRSARNFLKLQRLLQGLQAELDTSWAVLGEVFSRDERLRDLEIRLRRVRSNLDDPAVFLEREKSDYFPVKAAFDTAGADLLKLLIKPLYGDRPEIGIRELLQNALDAVRELRQWAADHEDPEMRKIPRPDQEADVLITIDKDVAGQTWLTITDKGIGMKVETVRDYFLKAGASFRQSDAWRSAFEDHGSSKILRSGRFGIGALATFLLGPRLEVTTRHVEVPASQGIHFVAAITDSEIELCRDHKDAVGTIIRIQLQKSACDIFFDAGEWDWFTLPDPTVERRLYGESLKQEFYLPRPGSRLPADWREIKANGYQHVYWTYSRTPRLTCNGLKIEFGRPSEVEGLASPFVSVFDADGSLPLSLQRDELSEFPFGRELGKDISADLIAFLLVHAPTTSSFSRHRWDLAPYFMRHRFHMRNLLGVNPEGLILNRLEYLKRAGITRIAAFFVKYLGNTNNIYFIAENEQAVTLTLEAEMFLAEISTGSSVQHGMGRLLSLEPATIQLLSKKHTIPVSQTVEGRVTQFSDDWEIANFSMNINDNVSDLKQIHRAISSSKGIELIAVAEGALGLGTIESKSPLDELFEKFAADPLIPFSIKKRHAKFARAFVELREYIETWQSPDLGGWRRDLLERIGAAGYQKDR